MVFLLFSACGKMPFKGSLEGNAALLSCAGGLMGAHFQMMDFVQGDLCVCMLRDLLISIPQ